MILAQMDGQLARYSFFCFVVSMGNHLWLMHGVLKKDIDVVLFRLRNWRLARAPRQSKPSILHVTPMVVFVVIFLVMPGIWARFGGRYGG